MEWVALVMAAGSGSRLGGELPKQYRPLAGRPMLRRTLDGLITCPGLGQIRVVIGAGQEDHYRAATHDLDLPPPVIGGATRQDSVRRGLEALASQAPAHVLVHDAARPFATPALIERVRAGLATEAAVLPVLPVVDTLKQVGEDGRVGAEVPRTGLGRAQTPQGFAFEALLRAHRHHAGRGCTDDAGVVALDGVPVLAVEGDEANFKVTTDADLARAETVLARRPRRWISASGFDVHAFAEGRPLMLCGIDLPHERGLAGHSDADVALHAITDALLGAVAEGDIGSHFPPSDERWRDVASARFLAHAAARVRARDGRIEHVDLTIIGERPRIGPHREALRASLAGLLALDQARVSVKATTTERLGFCGREEGLAAQATLSLSFPA